MKNFILHNLKFRLINTCPVMAMRSMKILRNLLDSFWCLDIKPKIKLINKKLFLMSMSESQVIFALTRLFLLKTFLR